MKNTVRTVRTVETCIVMTYEYDISPEIIGYESSKPYLKSLTKFLIWKKCVNIQQQFRGHINHYEYKGPLTTNLI